MWWMLVGVRYIAQSFVSGWQLAYGGYRLSRLKQPVVSVFGGGGAQRGSKHTEMVYEFAKLCTKSGFSILTGGGPGVMEAANCGARDGHQPAEKSSAYTLGISVKGLDIGFKNPCADVILVNDFFVRKQLLILYSKAFVVFPGGIGTMDEIFDVVNLAKHHLVSRIPLILVGKQFWEPIMSWYQQAVDQGLIKLEDSKLLICAETIEEVLELIQAK